MHLALLVVLLCCLARSRALPYHKEPQCHSKYDFEEKILEKVLRMELWVETMKTRVDTDLDKTAKDIDRFTREFGDIKREISDKMKDVDTNVKALDDKVDSTLQELDKEVADKMEQVDINVKTLEDKADSKLQEVEEQANEAARERKQILESAIKPDVVFLAKDVKGQPSIGDVIKFTSTLENVGDGYSLASGCFTAPTNGTYWFSAQVCSNTNKYLTVSIEIKGTLTTNSYAFIKDQSIDTASVHAVSILKVGDTVCLKNGSSTSSAFYNDSTYCFGNFMGALIN